ncbi:PAXNEB-domain-containing protein [Lentithecium fluviatile CBS 122367]|uniref:Elongator complex protein 4 n=1 Tax=Lentithecium fluviatile CBS 122367 TaxID=1168545 RepID=A0A6G1JCJ5_9PLEO|nr:PAXNEB-domain-containing protein [Lentithecium fluviatile CBS 122367]
MAFRKRNVALKRAPSGETNDNALLDPSSSPPATPATASASNPPTPGVRPSPVDGRPTTSTGTPSLDGILAGHAGLPLGTSLLIGENGTTEYATPLLRFYAAEGVVQGHKVHVVGMDEVWGRMLPGIAEERGSGKKREDAKERMKIAWRYEGLGQFESARGASANRSTAQADGSSAEDAALFCHTFDLAKRLTLPVGTAINYIPIPRTTSSPFAAILQNLQRQLALSLPNTVHRLVIPSLLSPAIYPPHSPQPSSVLQFLHALRALLRQYPTRLTAIITIPLSLYPRSTGLVRWMEILSDGVFELSPFAVSLHENLATSAGATKDEERPQGMFAVHKLPVFHEKGGRGGLEGLGEDLAFTLSRRKFVVAKFSLPPVEGDTEAQEAAVREVSGGSAMPRKEELEF